ncbi:MAG: class I SAM-dependent methyltransferase [Oscillospiraceae bacterium]|nr:class I SAM-dependent methyltransferase [Oscillospiraceae bacterium]
MNNTEKFSGKGAVYAQARPSYPQAAIDYICKFITPDSVVADIGAGTGKFTELLAKRNYNMFAVEPNSDMHEQLEITLKPFPNVKIINSTAEATTLPDNSVDLITVAQALHWFDPDKFRAECRRIGKENVRVIAIYNQTPGGSSVGHSKLSTDVFFENPTIREFPNSVFYTREKWIQYMTSHSHDPLPTDPNYETHIAEANAIFDKENENGLLRRDVMTKVYSEDFEV